MSCVKSVNLCYNGCIHLISIIAGCLRATTCTSGCVCVLYCTDLFVWLGCDVILKWVEARSEGSIMKHSRAHTHNAHAPSHATLALIIKLLMEESASEWMPTTSDVRERTPLTAPKSAPIAEAEPEGKHRVDSVQRRWLQSARARRRRRRYAAVSSNRGG